ncbi:MAG: hypothetical protein WC375_03820 [Methanomassiliicoccales archaeon]
MKGKDGPVVLLPRIAESRQNVRPNTAVVDSNRVNRRTAGCRRMGISKKDINRHKADKKEKMAALETKAASGSGAAKKKLAKMQKK